MMYRPREERRVIIIMRVNKIAIRKQTNAEYDKVILKLETPFEDFLQHIDITLYHQWDSKQLGSKYTIKKIQKNVVRFDYQYLLIETDHKDLLQVIEHILQEFTVYAIQYPTKYKELMEVFKRDIDKFDSCFIASLLTGTLFETFTFYYQQNQQNTHTLQEIQYRVSRLSEFKEEILVYTMQENDIRQKLGIKNITENDIRTFLGELVRIYGENIPKQINDRMNKIGLQGSAIIWKVDYFVDLEKLANMKVDIKGLSGQRYGLVLNTFGCQQSYSKLHTFIEKWLEKLSLAVVEVDSLQCCRKDQLPTHFSASFQGSHALPLSLCPQSKYQRILIFDPPTGSHVTKDLHHFFRSSNRIISGLNFPTCDFRLLHEHWNEFINVSKLELRTSIYEDYLIINCTKGQEMKLREKIKAFLQDRIIEEVKTGQFQTPFEVSLFKEIYCKQIVIKNADFFVSKVDGCVYRMNYVKDGQELDKKVREVYQQMRKSLVSVPISRPLHVKKSYFQQSRAIQWQDPECLQSQLFKIQKKITVHIRSFASISTNQQDCIFVVQDIEDSIELIDILNQDEITNLGQKLKSNPVLGFSLRYYRHFNAITACSVTLRKDRDSRWMRKLKDNFEKVISSHESSRHIKFMFHRNSQEAIQCLVPIIIDCVRSNCNLRAQSKLKQITFFTSLTGGKDLRSCIITKLKQVRQRNVAITKICDLNLRISDLEKIVTYGYYSLKYFEEDETHEGSPLNSFIFHHELRKKKKTPIFLPTIKQRKDGRAVEYLVSCFNDEVFKITGRKIQKSILDNPRLTKLKSIMKEYFIAIDFFVISGNDKGTYFCQRLFYTSTEQRHYKQLQIADIDVEKGKVMIRKKFMRYELIENEFMQLKKIDTHPSKIQELLGLIAASSPAVP